MTDSVKDQFSTPANSARSTSKLGYSLRSAAKSREEKPKAAELTNSSAPRRGRPPPSVSKSMGVVDLSGDEKLGKPVRRLSIPVKSNVSPVPKSVGTMTPISEARKRRSTNSEEKNGTPVSDVFRSSNREKFNLLASPSYWLAQIKLSESAAKHKISLGFFKLALEAGCEPLQKMRDKLKSYARQHDLTEFQEPVKELFESYNLSENFDQLQVSESCSQVPEEGTRSSDDEVHSSSVTENGKLKTKSLSTDESVEAFPLIESTRNNVNQKDHLGTRIKGTDKKNSTNARALSETTARSTSKKSQEPIKQVSNKDKDKQGKKPVGKQGPPNLFPMTEPLQEIKENTDTAQMEDIGPTEV
ncbi:hypothetical protein NMG60_11009592 [Bertholletia excelsa]